MKKLIILIICFLSVNLKAQWVSTSGPEGGYINCFAVSNSNIFAGTSGGGVFLFTNNGTNWTAVNTGLASSDIFSMVVSGSNIFAGTRNGVFFSTNNGTSWTAVGLGGLQVYSLAVSGTNLFAGTFGSGVALSTNNGTSQPKHNHTLCCKPKRIYISESV